MRGVVSSRVRLRAIACMWCTAAHPQSSAHLFEEGHTCVIPQQRRGNGAAERGFLGLPSRQQLLKQRIRTIVSFCISTKWVAQAGTRSCRQQESLLGSPEQAVREGGIPTTNSLRQRFVAATLERSSESSLWFTW